MRDLQNGKCQRKIIGNYVLSIDRRLQTQKQGLVHLATFQPDKEPLKESKHKTSKELDGDNLQLHESESPSDDVVVRKNNPKKITVLRPICCACLHSSSNQEPLQKKGPGSDTTFGGCLLVYKKNLKCNSRTTTCTYIDYAISMEKNHQKLEQSYQYK